MAALPLLCVIDIYLVGMECLMIDVQFNKPLYFQIAMGLPLYCMKDIRCLYGESPCGSSTINFEHPTLKPSPKGHVIAARITSENPDEVSKINSHC